jgi:RimJ/RimL family protein N-acetyltransferase
VRNGTRGANPFAHDGADALTRIDEFTMNPADIRIETARLLLRPPVLSDFDAWAQLAADEENMRHLGGVKPRPVAWRHFAFTVGSWHLQGFGAFSVIEKASGSWVGRVGALQPEGWPGTEVGWTLARAFWGRGFAIEAATVVIDWAFANLGWSDVIHCIGAENLASVAVATKLGSRKLRTATMPAPYEGIVVDIWGQSREEWRARRNDRIAT